jgi:hypothetical protein
VAFGTAVQEKITLLALATNVISIFGTLGAGLPITIV